MHWARLWSIGLGSGFTQCRFSPLGIFWMSTDAPVPLISRGSTPPTLTVLTAHYYTYCYTHYYSYTYSCTYSYTYYAEAQSAQSTQEAQQAQHARAAQSAL